MYDLVQIGLHSGAVVWIGNFWIKCQSARPPAKPNFFVNKQTLKLNEMFIIGIW